MISIVPFWTEPALQRRIAAAASIVLAVALAWLLARLIWQLRAGDDPVAVEPLAGVVSSRPAAAEIDLARHHLFGVYREHPLIAAYRDAPETSLKLQLRGIVSSSDPQSGFAIIVAAGRQAVYGIGQEVPGGAQVRGIYADRVVLFQDGRHETLRLPVKGSGTPPAVPDSESAGQAATAMPPISTSNWKDMLSLNLERNSGYSLIPVAGGGYRLFLSRGAQPIVDMGLRNGDVIRSASGIPLHNQADVERAFAKVLAGETLTLLVERDGAQLSLTPDIEKFVSAVR